MVIWGWGQVEFRKIGSFGGEDQRKLRAQRRRPLNPFLGNKPIGLDVNGQHDLPLASVPTLYELIGFAVGLVSWAIRFTLKYRVLPSAPIVLMKPLVYVLSKRGYRNDGMLTPVG